jgi:hypothetical protein
MKKIFALLFAIVLPSTLVFSQDNMFIYSITKYDDDGASLPLTKEHQTMELEQVYHPNNYCRLWTYYWESEEPSKMVWDFQISYINSKENILHAIDDNDSSFYSFVIQKDPLKYLGQYNYHGYQGGVFSIGFGNILTIYTCYEISSKANLGINYIYPHNIGAIARIIMNTGKEQIVFQLIKHGKSSSGDDKLVWKPNKISKTEMDKLSVIAWLLAGLGV